MWIGGSSDAAIRRTARYGTGWQSGAETPADVGKVVAAIKKAVAEAGRTIDEDHYGAAFPFYFGSPGDGIVSAAMAAYEKRTGRDPSGYFAIGDEKVILDRVAEYVGRRRREIHPAARRTERRRDHRPDQEADRKGAAAGRGALAEDGKR